MGRLERLQLAFRLGVLVDDLVGRRLGEDLVEAVGIGRTLGWPSRGRSLLQLMRSLAFIQASWCCMRTDAGIFSCSSSLMIAWLLVVFARSMASRSERVGPVSVVKHVSRRLDLGVGVFFLVLGDEVFHARKVEPLVPGRAEDAEEIGARETIDIGPILLVVDPSVFGAQLHLRDLRAQGLEVVAPYRGSDDVGIVLLRLEQNRAEIAGPLRDHDFAHDLRAVLGCQFAGRVGGVVPPDVVVGDEEPAFTELADGSSDRGAGEIVAVAIPYELDSVAIFA